MLYKIIGIAQKLDYYIVILFQVVKSNLGIGRTEENLGWMVRVAKRDRIKLPEDVINYQAAYIG